MSPEQVRGDRVDARTDVWAFGCLLYEMLTGHPAFGRSTVAETLSAVMEDEPDWARLPTSVPVGVRRLLRRCLARDPRRRLHHIADARLEMRTTPSPSRAAMPRTAWLPVRRERRLAVAVAALAVACAGALGVVLVRAPVAAPDLRAVEITTPRTPDPWSFAVSPDGRLAGVRGRTRRPADALGASPGRGHGRSRPAGHRRGAPPVLVAGQPLDRVLRRPARSSASTSPAGRHAASRYALAATAAAWGPDGTILFSGTSAPALHRVGAAGGTPRVGDGSSDRLDRPSTSPVPAGRPPVPVLRRRTGCAPRYPPRFARRSGGGAARRRPTGRVPTLRPAGCCSCGRRRSGRNASTSSSAA